MKDDKLSIYEVRTSIHYAFDTIEIIQARAQSHDAKLSEEDLSMLGRVKDELQRVAFSYWTMSVL